VNEDSITPVKRQWRLLGIVWWVWIAALSIVAGIGVLLFGRLHPVSTEIMQSPVMQAYVQVSALRESLIQYYKEYGTFPPKGEKEFYAVLAGENPRKIVFLKMEDYAAGKGGLREGVYLDPWGERWHRDLTNPKEPRVYSSGPNRQGEPNDPNSDDIRSW
ncbi:MAG: hypothetical protein ABIP97_00390, partial [Chthoniobacterales bacterium]